MIALVTMRVPTQKKKALPRHLDSDKKKPLSGLGVVSTPKYHEEKAVYISESDI